MIVLFLSYVLFHIACCQTPLPLTSTTAVDQSSDYIIDIETDVNEKDACKLNRKFLSLAFSIGQLNKTNNGYDVDSVKLQNLLKALSPSYIRLGGSRANFVAFQPRVHHTSSNVASIEQTTTLAPAIANVGTTTTSTPKPSLPKEPTDSNAEEIEPEQNKANPQKSPIENETEETPLEMPEENETDKEGDENPKNPPSPNKMPSHDENKNENKDKEENGDSQASPINMPKPPKFKPITTTTTTTTTTASPMVMPEPENVTIDDENTNNDENENEKASRPSENENTGNNYDNDDNSNSSSNPKKAPLPGGKEERKEDNVADEDDLTDLPKKKKKEKLAKRSNTFRPIKNKMQNKSKQSKVNKFGDEPIVTEGSMATNPPPTVTQPSSSSKSTGTTPYPIPIGKKNRKLRNKSKKKKLKYDNDIKMQDEVIDNSNANDEKEKENSEAENDMQELDNIKIKQNKTKKRKNEKKLYSPIGAVETTLSPTTIPLSSTTTPPAPTTTVSPAQNNDLDASGDGLPTNGPIGQQSSSGTNPLNNNLGAISDMPKQPKQNKKKKAKKNRKKKAKKNRKKKAKKNQKKKAPTDMTEEEFKKWKAEKRKGFKNYNMSADLFDDIYTLVKETKNDLIFDVNAFFRTSENEWDSTNAEKLLDYAHRKKYEIDWQLGNEPNSYKKYGHQMSGQQVGKDYCKFYQLTRGKIMKNKKIIGPDPTRPKQNGKVEKFLFDFLKVAKDCIDVLTWHQYYVNGRTATEEKFMDPMVLDEFKAQCIRMKTVADRSNFKKPIWMTETGSAWGGGAMDMSNRYIGGFPYLDKLGIAGQQCVKVVARQTFLSGKYAMVDIENYRPHPDYYLAVIFKRLVGQIVLKSTTKSNDGSPISDKHFRMYAHCSKKSRSNTPGSVVVYGLNLHKTEKKFSFQGYELMEIKQYVLTADDLKSDIVKLNGATLEMDGDNLPKMHGKIVTQPVTLPAQSFGFFVIDTAVASVCS